MSMMEWAKREVEIASKRESLLLRLRIQRMYGMYVAEEKMVE